jgi:hypothetical protein
MRQIFVFTAGNPEARHHLIDSVQNPVDDAVVFDNFDEAHYEELERIKDKAGGFYAWGAVEKTSFSVVVFASTEYTYHKREIGLRALLTFHVRYLPIRPTC